MGGCCWQSCKVLLEVSIIPWTGRWKESQRWLLGYLAVTQSWPVSLLWGQHRAVLCFIGLLVALPVSSCIPYIEACSSRWYQSAATLQLCAWVPSVGGDCLRFLTCCSLWIYFNQFNAGYSHHRCRFLLLLLLEPFWWKILWCVWALKAGQCLIHMNLFTKLDTGNMAE